PPAPVISELLPATGPRPRDCVPGRRALLPALRQTPRRPWLRAPAPRPARGSRAESPSMWARSSGRAAAAAPRCPRAL
ncbi:hypothetical protein P7K49_004516, partial [Saguinus oedipus]